MARTCPRARCSSERRSPHSPQRHPDRSPSTRSRSCSGPQDDRRPTRCRPRCPSCAGSWRRRRSRATVARTASSAPRPTSPISCELGRAATGNGSRSSSTDPRSPTSTVRRSRLRSWPASRRRSGRLAATDSTWSSPATTRAVPSSSSSRSSPPNRSTSTGGRCWSGRTRAAVGGPTRSTATSGPGVCSPRSSASNPGVRFVAPRRRRSPSAVSAARRSTRRRPCRCEPDPACRCSSRPSSDVSGRSTISPSPSPATGSSPWSARAGRGRQPRAWSWPADWGPRSPSRSWPPSSTVTGWCARSPGRSGSPRTSRAP